MAARRSRACLIFTAIAGCLLVVAAPAAAVDAPACSGTEVWARPGVTRTYTLNCQRTERIELVSGPTASQFEGLDQGDALKFRLTPDTAAPADDELTLRLTGPGGSDDAVVTIHNVPLSVNTPPRCTPVDVAQRTGGVVPEPINFVVSCQDDEHDDYTIYGNGPGTHPDAPYRWTADRGSPSWDYVPSIASGEERSSYYAIDELGARSADAPIHVRFGAAVDRLPVCRALDSGRQLVFGVRPGGDLYFTMFCEDPDGDPLTPRMLTSPAHGDLTFRTWTQYGFYGARAYIKMHYTPTSRFDGQDPFTLVAGGPDGDAPVTDVAMVERPLPANVPASCWMNAGRATPGSETQIPGSCQDEDGDPIAVRVVAPPQHGRVGTPVLTRDYFDDENVAIPYVADPAFVGTDWLTIEVTDGIGATQRLDVSVGVGIDPYALPSDGAPIGTPYDGPELHATATPTPTATRRPVTAAGAGVTPLDQARRALGGRPVRLLKRIGDARVYGPRTMPKAVARQKALAVTCPLGCSLTASSTIAGRSAGHSRLRVAPGRASALTLRLSSRQRAHLRRAGGGAVVVALRVTRPGAKARRAAVRVTLRR